VPTRRTGHRRADAVRFDRDSVEFGRALAFFDATFAIATTLLVTTLSPGEQGWASWSNLVDAVGGPLVAFGISFVVIASYWWGNHQFVAGLRCLSPRLVVGTLWLLAFVVLLPFTTEGLGEGLGSAEVTTVVYALNVALVSSTELVLYRIAVAQGLFVIAPSTTEIMTSTVCQLLPAAVFLLSIPVALLGGPIAARWMWLTLLVIAPLAGRWAARRVEASEAALEQ
jgi:uncharacterized membrane protein